ncbi:20723_t:CDS:2, partial [Funneliformis geosporum]
MLEATNQNRDYNLAKSYQNGSGIENDLEKAFELYQKLAKDEYIDAKYDLAKSNQNNSDAQYHLAECYQNGWGTKKDLKNAFHWYQESVKNENKVAQYYLAECYQNGWRIKKDEVKAFELYEKSAIQEYNVLHRDLHSKNILIHNNNVKITDFGISKIGNNSTRHIGPCGKIAYIDPQILINHNFQYKKPSDIYSYGVLMWEISSGYPPFKDLNDTTICAAIINNNALIHEDNAKITDFGISKVENNSTMHIGLFGKAAYMEPQILTDQSFQYIKASDIYSYGILMWEISSGYPPFEDKYNNNQDLIIDITCHK